MAMSDEKRDVDRKFMSIIVPQVHIEMSNTLGDMLASSVNHDISPSAIDYVLRKLWISDLDPRS